MDGIRAARLHPPAGRVLVADDDPDVVRDLELLLTTLGYDVRTAADGVEAMKVASEFWPHAAVLGVRLRRLGGRRVARRLRITEFGWLRVLIALTDVHGSPEDRSLRTVGFDYRLQKPVDPELLAALLVRGRPRPHSKDLRVPFGHQVTGIAP